MGLIIVGAGDTIRFSVRTAHTTSNSNHKLIHCPLRFGQDDWARDPACSVCGRFFLFAIAPPGFSPPL